MCVNCVYRVQVYGPLNQALRAQNRDAVKPWRAFIWLLMHALRKVPAVRSGVTVYRGMSISLSKLGANYATGGMFHLPAFTSTSSHVEVMHSFMGGGAKVMLHLTLTEDVARNITDFSLFATEREVLLPPNMLFRVKSSYHDDISGLHILQCTQLDTLDMILNF
jgi:hypothetical protein